MSRMQWLGRAVAVGATVGVLVLAVYTLGRRVDRIELAHEEADPIDVAELQALEARLLEAAMQVPLEATAVFSATWARNPPYEWGRVEATVLLELSNEASDAPDGARTAQRARRPEAVQHDVHAIVRTIALDERLRAADVVQVAVHPVVGAGQRGMEPIALLSLAQDALHALDWQTASAAELWDLARVRGHVVEPHM